MKTEYRHPSLAFLTVSTKDVITLSAGENGDSFKTSWDDQITLGY